MPKKKTEAQKQLEAEVKKNLRRIKRFVKSAEKRGYSFSDKAIPTLPKTITQKTLSYYQSIKPEKLYKKAVYVSPEGTKIKGTVRRAQERSQASKKAAETRKRYFEEKLMEDLGRKQRDYHDYSDSYTEEPVESSKIILQNLLDMFENWEPLSSWSKTLQEYKTRDRNRGLGIIHGAIENLGEQQVAINAENNAIELMDLAQRILYESGNGYREDSRNGEINLALNKLASILYARNLSISESMNITELSEMNETF